MITSYVQNQVVDCGTVDLTAFISDTSAAFGGETISDLAITKVTFNGAETTDGFSSFNMSKPGYYHVSYQPDKLTDFLETIKNRCQFSKWFCGHYHVNQVIDEQFVIQWEQISRIDCN